MEKNAAASYLLLCCLIRAKKIRVKGVGPTACMKDEKNVKKLSWKMCSEENTGRIILNGSKKKRCVSGIDSSG